jgi:putative transcriptional regulator
VKHDDTEETLMSTFGKELIQSAKEARAFARGEADGKAFRVRVPQEVDVRALRAKLDMTQAAFADRFGFDVSAVRDWEQKRRQPDRSARVLLTVIDHSPDVVDAALRSAHSSSGRRAATGTRTARAGRSASKASRPAGRSAKASARN